MTIFTAVSFIISALVAAADQLTKALICPGLVTGGPRSVIPGLIGFEYVRNTGMAWGLLKNARVFLIVFSILASIAMIWLMIKLVKNAPRGVIIGFALVLGGAVGNIIDRIALGYVRDFIAFEFIEFPVFNVADVAVTLGAALIVIVLVFTERGRAFFGELIKDEPKPGETVQNGEEPREE